jgi:hypothetical protein
MIKTIFFKALFIYVFSISWINANSQNDDAWWNEIHHWDGVTHWSDYIIYSPFYLGPNALSVPYSQKGLVKSNGEFEMDFNFHWSKGDKTKNLFLSLYLPVVRNVIAFEFYGVPAEWYNIDEVTVIERRGRNRSGNGWAVGDFYFSTVIQLIKEKKIPDIALRMACRTASGSKLSDARFTDAPGYFFDLSYGKDVYFNNNKSHKMRIHAMAGFYSWQMNLPDNRQNDAILYGFGVDYLFEDLHLTNAIEGYSGYFGNTDVFPGNKDIAVIFNDRPLLYRFEAIQYVNMIGINLCFQSGLNDFSYQSISIGITYRFLHN